MTMLHALPSAAKIEEIRKDLLQSLDDILSKVDVDILRDFWHKWRLPISAVCGALTCTFFLTKACRAMNRTLKQRALQSIIEERRGQRASNIDQLYKRLEMSASVNVLVKRREIVLLHFEELSRRLQKGILSAVEVLEAYQWRALEAHAQTNCICRFLPDAPAWAAALDTRYSQNSSSDKRPPLFGIPVSVCEAFQLSGQDSSLGLVTLLNQPGKEDAVLIRTLKQMGAVPFLVTNVSQGLLSVGCSNPIYGPTTNPNDPMRSAGGASGGEAALIAMLGSPIGLGVDDPGGGLSVPAHWCGVCCLKPSSLRLSNAGTRRVAMRRRREFGTVGLMGPNVDSVVATMRAVCSPSSIMYLADPYAAPLAFNEDLYKDTRPLTIGYYHCDGVLSPVAACVRAVDVARRILEGKGHLLVQIPLPCSAEEMRQMVAAYVATFLPDSGASLLQLYQDDIVDTSLRDFLQFLSLSSNQRSRLSRKASSQRLRVLYNAFSTTISEQESIWSKIDSFRSKFIRFCSERTIDCLLCPAFASTPMTEDTVGKMSFLPWWYSAMYSVLDFPAGVVRCTTVTIGDERAAVMGLDEVEDDWISQEIRRAAEGTVGLPVGVQCVALPFREEMCLRMMKDIETGART